MTFRMPGKLQKANLINTYSHH